MILAGIRQRSPRRRSSSISASPGRCRQDKPPRLVMGSLAPVVPRVAAGGHSGDHRQCLADDSRGFSANRDACRREINDRLRHPAAVILHEGHLDVLSVTR